jgi:hypothetical protein
MKTRSKDSFLVVSKKIVEQAAAECSDDPDNGFQKVLDAYHQYEEAGMTPIFLSDSDFQDLYCVCKETYKKLLN